MLKRSSASRGEVGESEPALSGVCLRPCKGFACASGTMAGRQRQAGQQPPLRHPQLAHCPAHSLSHPPTHPLIHPPTHSLTEGSYGSTPAATRAYLRANLMAPSFASVPLLQKKALSAKLLDTSRLASSTCTRACTSVCVCVDLRGGRGKRGQGKEQEEVCCRAQAVSAARAPGPTRDAVAGVTGRMRVTDTHGLRILLGRLSSAYGSVQRACVSW